MGNPDDTTPDDLPEEDLERTETLADPNEGSQEKFQQTLEAMGKSVRGALKDLWTDFWK